MGIALGGADLGMAKQPPDHFQRCAAGDEQGGEVMAQIVDTDIRNFGLHAHPLPEALEVNHRLARDIAREKKRAALGTASLRSRIRATASCEIGTRSTRRCLVWKRRTQTRPGDHWAGAIVFRSSGKKAIILPSSSGVFQNLLGDGMGRTLSEMIKNMNYINNILRVIGGAEGERVSTLNPPSFSAAYTASTAFTLPDCVTNCQGGNGSLLALCNRGLLLPLARRRLQRRVVHDEIGRYA